MAFKYPAEANTVSLRTEYCYAMQEKLRLEHNKKGKDFEDGVITDKEWKAYKKDRFEGKQEKIIAELLKERQKMKESTKFTLNLDDMDT